MTLFTLKSDYVKYKNPKVLKVSHSPKKGTNSPSKQLTFYIGI